MTVSPTDKPGAAQQVLVEMTAWSGKSKNVPALHISKASSIETDQVQTVPAGQLLQKDEPFKFKHEQAPRILSMPFND